jgi:hypothetical protein
MAIGYVNNLASFSRTIVREKARVKGTATAVYQKFVKDILTDLAKNTPQWSGDLAASWEVVVSANGVPSGYTSPFKSFPPAYPAPHEKGDMEAVKYAISNNKQTIDAIRWNNIVSVVNMNPTIKLIGDGSKLRPGNYIPGDIMAVNFVAHKWSHKRGYRDLNLGTSNEP